MIRTLLIEDSGFMRILISDLLRRDPAIEVVGTANNGKEGLEKVKVHKPDVVITDMVMPDYDGLFVVNQIMKEVPTPVVLLSALDKTDAKVFDALNAGAFDFVDKPKNNFAAEFKEANYPLLEIVKEAATARTGALRKKNTKKNNFAHTFGSNLNYDIIAIGASTGGPGAIETILKKLPENLTIPIVIVQHMPERFLESFAQRLNNIFPVQVKLAEKGEELKGGIIYLAPGMSNMLVKLNRSTNKVVFDFTDKQYKEFNNPSINCLLESVAETFGKKSIGVVLTGMGRDGTEGLKAIADKGGFTVAQDEKTSVVFGMPKSAWDSGAAKHLVALQEIPAFLVSCL